MKKDLPVHDVVDVEMVDAEKDLLEDLKGLLLWKPFSLFEDVEEFLASDELSDEEEMFLVFVETIAHHDIWVILSYILGTMSLRI